MSTGRLGDPARGVPRFVVRKVWPCPPVRWEDVRWGAHIAVVRTEGQDVEAQEFSAPPSGSSGMVGATRAGGGSARRA